MKRTYGLHAVLKPSAAVSLAPDGRRGRGAAPLFPNSRLTTQNSKPTRAAATLPASTFNLKPFPRLTLILLLISWLVPTAFAQLGGSGWTSFPVVFNVQWPTNAAENTRYFVTNEPNATYHCLVYSNDGAFSLGNTTKPRTEQRFTPDYTNGEIQYQSLEMAPSNENSYCVFQIHTGDAQSPTYGSTTFMLFWFTNNNGSVNDYSGTQLATNLGNQWFQLNVDHNVATGLISVWINKSLVWTQQDNGAGDFYFKDGVYEQSHNPTLRMDTYITNILMWTSSGTNQTATSYWNGGSKSDGNWSDPTNWNGTGISSNYALLFGGTNRLASTNNTPAGTAYSDLIFNPAAGAFTLAGNPLTLTGTLTNNSSVPQTLTLGLLFSNSLVFDGAGAPLIIGGGLTNTPGPPGATTLTLADTGTLTNLFNSATSPGGTNVLALNSATANWTILDNPAALAITVPWALSINSGTLDFGNSGSAPNLTGTAVNGVPQDNELGSLSNSVGTLNIFNGTLTTLARLDTATTLNATGIVNQTGGTFTIGSQFQGANGGNLGEISFVNLTGGTMNIGTAANPTATFYTASRGTGTLTLGNSAVLNCGTLDVSRNASGNTFGSVGTVNLNGGAIAASHVGTATANSQTNWTLGSAATFNFNGGTLKITSATTPFFQGSTVAPFIPITAIVKSGGAIIDSNGKTNVFAEPLLHDPTLGTTPDGGLTKNGSGCLFLLSNLTCTGDTVVNTGTLALTNAVSLNTSPQITIAAGAVLDVTGRTNGQLALISGQTLSGAGTIRGTTLVSSNATLAPGSTNGTLAFTGSLILSNGSTAIFALSKSPATNELVQVATALTYGGTLLLTNVSPTPLVAGDSFKLFSAATCSGAFAAVTPALPGLNLAWNTNSLSSGTVSVISLPTALPKFASLALNSTNFVCHGSNGVPDWPYLVLTATNLALPVSNWTVISTNTFDSAGNFTFTNPVSPATTRQFWLIQLKP